jgi:S1-C subfamily serine protease
MSNGLVIHVESEKDKHTEILTTDRILIGTSEECDLRLRGEELPAAVSTQHRIIELARSNGHYLISDFDPEVDAWLNGVPLTAGSPIGDGDLLRISGCDLSLQFFPIGGVPTALTRSVQEAHVAPFIENAALESAATARRDDAKVFLREFTRELVREISLSTKIATLAIALALVGGVLYLGFALYNEARKSRNVINEQQAQLKKMTEQVNLTNEQISDIDRQNSVLLSSMTFAPRIRKDYGSGVCLISGSFYFAEAGTGRPLRYLETRTGEDGTVIQSGTDTSQLTPEGAGAIAEFEFVGTGFYVGGGYVLTNRHVAQPWQADERAQTLTSTVNGQPRLKKLVAFFPGRRQAIGLRFRQASQRDDLAVCTLDTKDVPSTIPVLPLDKDSDAIAIGKAVVMMGYPSGPDRLLALLDDAEARNVQARYGSSLESLLDYLASRNHIQPLTTQGHITDLDARRIVYDARTAEGGSGAPLFGQSGRVIGINFAVFTENSASNFAVPARAAEALLQKAGWKVPEVPRETGADGTEANQNSNRTNTAAVQR